MHTALVCITLLPEVHTAFSNKCLACHAFIKSCERTPPVKHFSTNVCLSCIQYLCAQHCYQWCTHSIFHKCLAFNAYTESCRRTPPVMHTPFPANASPYHISSTHAPNTVSSWAHSKPQQMLGLPHTHQPLQ